MVIRTNPVGVHALVWVGNTSAGEVERAVAMTVETGFDLLELSLHDLDSLDIAHAREQIDAVGIGVACSRGLSFDADVSSEDTAVVTRGADLLQRSLRATSQLGGQVLTGALYSALGKYDRSPGPAGRSNAVAVLRDLAQEARGLGLQLGLEVCNRYETNLINTAADALAFTDAIGEDNVMIHLDTYHMNIEEDDFVRPVRLVGDRLGYVHIGENHRGYLGTGHLDFTSFFHALSDIGFHGPITFESFSSAVVARRLSSDLAVWRDLWDDGEDLARHARSYIEVQLAGGRRR